MRLLADENFNGGILRGVLLRIPDADIVRVQDTVIVGVGDPELLEWAARQGRIILTHDINTLIGFAYERVAQNLPMSGVFIVLPDADIGEAVESLTLVLEAGNADEYENQVIYLPF